MPDELDTNDERDEYGFSEAMAAFHEEADYQARVAVSYPIDDIQRAAVRFCREHGVAI